MSGIFDSTAAILRMFATDEGSELIPSSVYILPEGLLLGIELTLVDSDRSSIICVPLYSFTYTCGTPVVDDTLSNLLFNCSVTLVLNSSNS